MDHSTSSGDDDRDRYHHEHPDPSVSSNRASSSSQHREGSHESRPWNPRQQYSHYNYPSRDYDTRSQSSQKSDPNSETSGNQAHYNMSANSSVGSHGSGGGDSRGFPLHSHVHFRHTANLLNGDPAHQFPPSLYQASADAPKSDTATVCSSSMLEDIEDVGSHYDGDSISQMSSSKQYHHHYPPPTSSLRRSNSKEGNRLVDFADRSQAVFPKQSKSSNSHVASQESNNSSSNNNNNSEEEVSAGNPLPNRKGMGPPLSRHWLMQHHGISPFRTGSVKSGGSNAGSDVVVNVGSDCGGSLTDVQSVMSQEDAALLTGANSEPSSEAPNPLAVSAPPLDASGSATSAAEDEKPHPLLCDGNKTSGRISPGGTIYRGRGVRRYKGRFYALPLKRFHQDGVHLHSDSGGGDNHNYYGHTPTHCRDRSRSRSRSRSPPAGDERRKDRNANFDRGYKIDEVDKGGSN